MKTVIIISPKYKNISSFINLLPQNFCSEGTTIYKARNEIRNFEVDGRIFTVKGYKKPHLINQIAYGLFRESKARRAYYYAQRLLENNILTPEPVAYIEQYQAGLLTNSYFVSLFANDSHILRELVDYSVKGNEDLLTALAAYTASIHKKNIYPIDYSPGNVLFEKVNNNYRFTILDINRMKFKAVSEKMAARGFRRFDMKPAVVEFIAKEYAAIMGFNPATFSQEAIRHHAAFWSRH